MKEVIFDLRRRDYSYKGVLFAELDTNESAREIHFPFAPPKDYICGVMAIVYTDENGNWHLKARIKFPSGNKVAIPIEGGKDSNEEKMLEQLYRVPMIHKIWTANPDGTPEGIVKIIQDLDMVEYSRIVED